MRAKQPRVVTVPVVREAELTYEVRPRLTTAEEAQRFLANHVFPNLPKVECFVLVSLNVRHCVVAADLVSVGCLTSSLVHPREVFNAAIRRNAVAIVLAHNHPSGDAEPSQDDVALTRRLASGGTLLGIEVVDHIILGEGCRFVSLKQRGVV